MGESRIHASIESLGSGNRPDDSAHTQDMAHGHAHAHRDAHTYANDPSITVTVLNASSSTICRLEVYPTIDLSGNNRLSNPLEPDSEIDIKLSGEARVYDFKALDCDSQLVDELLGKTITDGFTWVITD